MRAHIVENGKIINTIVVESLDIIPGLIDAANGGTIGDLWDGQTFTTPPKTPEQIAEEARIAAKAQDFLDNIPSWAGVSTAVDNIANLADAKVFIKKLARIVYWLAKDKIE